MSTELSPAPTPTSPSEGNATPRRGCLSAGFYAPWRTLLFCFRHWKFSLVALIILFLTLVLWKIKQQMESGKPLAAISHPIAIEETDEEVRSLREIKKLEFLAVDTEELVEGNERGTFSNKQLVQIFRGTLRIGIRMDAVSADWFSGGKGTAVLRLPDVCLLDSAFIDETRTTTFHQTGHWSAADKQKLYHRAQQAMIDRALSPHNLREARKSAEAQFRKLLNAFGYDEVIIHFGNGKTPA